MNAVFNVLAKFTTWLWAHELEPRRRLEEWLDAGGVFQPRYERLVNILLILAVVTMAAVCVWPR